MFTVGERDYVRERVLDNARADPRVTSGALTGSSAVGAEDEWSDIDLAFGIAEGNSPESVLADWTEIFNRDLGVLHACSSIERGKLWRAEYWISGIRDQTLALACLRLAEETYYARGVDRLPAEVTAPLEDALVRALDEPELRRALAAATGCYLRELEEWDPALCARLKVPFKEFGAMGQQHPST